MLDGEDVCVHGEIDTETYELTKIHIKTKLVEIEAKIDNELPHKSNLVKMIDSSLLKATKLNDIWGYIDLENKKNLSRVVFLTQFFMMRKIIVI